MKIKQVDAEYTYDYDLDIVNIKIKDGYIYRESVDFDVGVFLDFDTNSFPVNLEIISASKRLNVQKDYLIKPGGNVIISINSDLIELDIHFNNHGEEHALHYADKHAENLQMTNLETRFAIV